VDALRKGGATLFEPVPEPRVVNLVASGNLGARIALSRLAIALELERVEYDPEQFAGLVYRSGDGTALVFASGAVVIMGARSVEGARSVAAEVRDVVDRVGAWHAYS
jgi:transcription initiation factor TFIID TATA-box-binding protein